MKKLLPFLTTIVLITQSSLLITSQIKSNQIQNSNVETSTLNTNHKPFLDGIGEAQKKSLKEVWSQYGKISDLKEVLEKSEAYFVWRSSGIKFMLQYNSYYSGVESLNQAYSDLEDINDSGYLEFFAPDKKKIWATEFNSLFTKWKAIFDEINDWFSKDNDDAKYKEFDNYLLKIQEIETIFENYNKDGKLQAKNDIARDMTTEENLKTIVRKYDILMRKYGQATSGENDLHQSKISLEVFRQYLNLEHQIHTRLRADIKEFITLFLTNIKRRAEKLNAQIDQVKSDDKFAAKFDELHHQYLSYQAEAKFIEDEALRDTPAFLLDVRYFLWQIEGHFRKAGVEMTTAFTKHFKLMLATIETNAKTVTSEGSWKELEKVTTEFKKAHQLFKKMAAENKDLYLEYNNVKQSISDVQEALTKVNFKGFDYIKIESGGISFQVSDSTWAAITGKGNIGSGVSVAIFSGATTLTGIFNFAKKTFTILGKAFTIGKWTGRLLGGLVGTIIGFVVFQLPMMILGSIETIGTGGTFFIPYVTFTPTPFVYGQIALSVKATFKQQKLRYLDTVEKD